jgi:hypothetical protein
MQCLRIALAVLARGAPLTRAQLQLLVSCVNVNITQKNRVLWMQAQMALFEGTGWVFVGGSVTAPLRGNGWLEEWATACGH